MVGSDTPQRESALAYSFPAEDVMAKLHKTEKINAASRFERRATPEREIPLNHLYSEVEKDFIGTDAQGISEIFRCLNATKFPKTPTA